MAWYEITNESGPIDFECQSDQVERTLQNCKNLLMTRMGEVPFDRQRGLNPKLFDLPLPEMKEALMPELDRVLLWEPDAVGVRASVEHNTEGEVIIRCVVEINIKE